MLTENALWQLLDQGVGRALMFLFYACIPLLIGVEDYGDFAFLQAVMFVLVQPLMVLGLDVVIVKRVARGERDVLYPALRIRAGLIAATGVLAMAASSARADIGVVFLIWLYLAVLSFESLLFAYYRGLESMRMEGVVGVLQKALALPFLGLLAALGVGGAALPAASLALMACAGLAIMGGRYQRSLVDLFAATERSTARPHARALLREGVVVGLAAFVSIIYFRIDSVMLGLLADREAVSVYNVAYRFMEAAFIIPLSMTNVLFPRLARAARPAATLRAAALLLAVLGVAASATVYTAGPPLIAWLYGAEYARAGRALAVLALAIPPVYVGALLTQALIAFERPGAFLRITVLGVVVNVLLNLLLIPAHGEIGAAVATLATELAVALLAAAALRRPPHTHKPSPLGGRR